MAIINKSRQKNRLRVALVHDYLRTYGGGERVLEALHEIWPDAPVYVATHNSQQMGVFGARFKHMKIITSWAQKNPLFRKKPIFYRFLLPFIWSSFNFGNYDVVISSSGANMAKNISVPSSVFHICYCHTPPRFLYNYETESALLNSRLLKFLLSPFLFLLRKYDQQGAQGVDFFIANSETVKKRISQFYRKDAEVISPPVTLPKISGQKKTVLNDYYLVVSRLVKHKHVDMIVEATKNLSKKLIVIGSGPEEKKLKTLANSNIRFLGSVPDMELVQYYHHAKALLLASQDEDFGITAIEALSFGKPVIAFASGGITENVIHKKTGILYYKMNAQALASAIKVFEETSIPAATCKKQVEQYTQKAFKKKITKVVQAALRQKMGRKHHSVQISGL